MITLTAEIILKGENPSPFQLGVSPLGVGLLGETIDRTEVINKRNILSLNSEIRDRADIDKPSFGIISTGGSLSFKDSSSRFLHYANAGVLTEGVEIKIFVENTVKKTRKQVGTYYTTDWDYDNDNRSVTVSFKDDLEEWQNIVFEGLVYSEGFYLLQLYQKLKDITEQKGYAFEDSNISSKFYNFLSKTYCPYPYLEQGNLWNTWRKFCDACSCYIFINTNGKIAVNYDFED